MVLVVLLLALLLLLLEFGTHRDWGVDGLHIGLLNEQVLYVVAQPLQAGFRDAHAALELCDPFV